MAFCDAARFGLTFPQMMMARAKNAKPVEG